MRDNRTGRGVVRTAAKNFTWRQRAGALLLDFPRFLGSAVRSSGEWVRFRNRDDRLTRNPDGRGVRCDWEFTRRLHLCNVFPSTASALLRRATKEWPIEFSHNPLSVSPSGVCSNTATTDDAGPEVSFVIGHRGTARLPHLLLTLQSIAAQKSIRFECIVVEQDARAQVRDALPGWVRYLHTPAPAGLPFCRSWAFNAAAGIARSPMLIFHDNDMLVPSAYAAEIHEKFRAGFEAINLKRFIFYMGRTNLLEAERFRSAEKLDVDYVVENLEGGGSVALSREAFMAIGGFDEEFIGWGGEDNEFWDRCLTRKTWEWTYLPIVHVWHEPQQGKRAVKGLGANTAELTAKRRAIPPAERISELVARVRGLHSWEDREFPT